MIRQLLLAVASLVAPELLAAQRASLPTPLHLPEGGEERVAVTLARRVSEGGERGLAALLAALRASGIAVREPGGRVIVAPAQPAQGIAVDPWEVRWMANLAVAGPEHRFGEIVDLLATRLPSLDKARVEEALQQDLIEGGSQPTIRFWKLFLIALNPAALGVGVADSDTTFTLSALQTALIVRRLSAELFVAGRGPAGGGRSDGAVESSAERPLERSTGGPSAGAPRELVMGGELLLPAPCTFGDMDWVIDVAATGLTTGFGKVMDVLGGAAEKLGTYTGLANIAFAYSKLLMAMGALKVQFEVEPPGAPLVRTKTTQAGSVRYVRATVRIDVGGAEAINCARTALNVAGLDFTTPKNGPLAGVEVSWSFLDRPSLVESGSADWIVRFAAKSRPDRGTTDKDGTARIGIEGSPQRVQLDDEYLLPDTTAVTLLLLTTLKPQDLLPDLREISLGAAGGILSAVATLPAELISRTRWFGGRYALPVVDWKYGFNMTITGQYDDPICEEREGWDMTEAYEGTVPIDITTQSAKGSGEGRWSVRGLGCDAMKNPDADDPPEVLCTLKIDAGGIGRFELTLYKEDELMAGLSFSPDRKRSHATVTGTCPDDKKEELRKRVGNVTGNFPISKAMGSTHPLAPADIYVVRLSPPKRGPNPR